MYPHNFHLFSLVKLAVIALIVSPCFSSCEKEPEPLTTNSSITGRVSVYDIAENNTPRVKITATGPYRSTTVYSDINGLFWFSNMGNGTYNIEATFPGYGTVKHYGVQVFGNDTAYVNLEQLYQLPASYLKAPEISEILVSENYYLYITPAVITNCETNQIPLRIFFSTDSKVSYNNYEGTSVIYTDWQCKYYCTLPGIHYLHQISFKSGQKIYAVAYVCNVNDRGYLDPYVNRLVFSSLLTKNKTNTVSFIIP